MIDSICIKCGREFTPKVPWAKKCVFCWAEEQERIHPPKICAICGKEFSPILEWYECCPDCYKEKHK